MNQSIASIARFFAACAMISFISCARTPEPCIVVDKGKIAKVNEEVQFNASCSLHADKFLWEFDGGVTASGAIIKHKFDREGDYSIKLTASNSVRSAMIRYQITIIK